MFEDFKKFAGNLFERNDSSNDNYFDLSDVDIDKFLETGLGEDNPQIALTKACGSQFCKDIISW